MLPGSFGLEKTHIISSYILVDVASSYCRGLGSVVSTLQFYKVYTFLIAIFLKIQNERNYFLTYTRIQQYTSNLRLDNHKTGSSGMELEHLNNFPPDLVFFLVLFFFWHFFSFDFRPSIPHGEESSLTESKSHIC